MQVQVEEEDSRQDPNQRKVARRHLIYYLRVFDTASGELLGNLVDISTNGIMLVSDKPVKSNVHYRLMMVLPETVDGSRDVHFDAESRWCQKDANQDFYDAGFELLNPSMEFMDAVDKLVEDCLFKE